MIKAALRAGNLSLREKVGIITEGWVPTERVQKILDAIKSNSVENSSVVHHWKLDVIDESTPDGMRMLAAEMLENGYDSHLLVVEVAQGVGKMHMDVVEVKRRSVTKKMRDTLCIDSGDDGFVSLYVEEVLDGIKNRYNHSYAMMRALKMWIINEVSSDNERMNSAEVLENGWSDELESVNDRRLFTANQIVDLMLKFHMKVNPNSPLDF